MESIVIDGVKYVSEQPVDPSKYVIVRTEHAGVFAGELESRTGGEAVIRQARRLWMWAGAATLSQMAIDGVSKPKECKFPEAVPSITVLGIIEILPCSAKARKSITEVPAWKA